MGGRRILLTGGGGFIGRNLLGSELARRHQVLAPTHQELDLTDTAAVDAWFQAHPVDVVIHAAMKPGHRNAKDPQGMLQADLRMFFNLARQQGRVERLVLLGSGAAYGAPMGSRRIPESAFGAQLPGDDYGLHKYIAGQYLLKCDNMVGLLLFGVFGPHEDYAIRFVSNCMCKALLGMPLTLRQDRRFDYLWVGDLAPVLLHLVEGAPRHRLYNVTPDETASLLDLASRIQALSGRDLELRVGQAGLGPEYSGDNARLKAELPGFKPTPLTDSLPWLYRWYQERLDRIDRGVLLQDR